MASCDRILLSALRGRMSSSDEESEPCCSWCPCWAPLSSSHDERGPLVAKSSKNGKQRSKPLLRMRWGGGAAVEVGEPAAASLAEGGHIFNFAGGRYEVGAEVGRGAHCVVWLCERIGKRGDALKATHSMFALKVHNEEASALQREADALRALRETCRGAGAVLFPQLLGTVRIAGRTGLALSLHGPDLYLLQKQRERKPFPPEFAWGVARQLLRALTALEEIDLVHADIKPQNILLHASDDLTLDGSAPEPPHARAATTAVNACGAARVCTADLAGGRRVCARAFAAGRRAWCSSTSARASRPSTCCAPPTASPTCRAAGTTTRARARAPSPPVAACMCVRIHDASAHQSTRTRASVRPRVRRYRAPEVILWSPISHCADTWSVGCVIAEVALGVPLLPGESEYNQLCRVCNLFGAPPPALLQRSHRAELFFDCGPDGAGADGCGALLHAGRARDEPPLVRYLPHDDLEALLESIVSDADLVQRHALLLLLDGLLRWDPRERWSGARIMQRLERALASQGLAWSNPAIGVVPTLS